MKISACSLIFLLASSSCSALTWSDWWQRPDQQAARALAQGDPRHAAELFTRNDWQAVAHYRAGQYEQAAKKFSQPQSADANYNRGNALAYAGDYQAALSAYDQALKINPAMADAKYNRDLVAHLLQQQPPPPSQQKSSQSSSQDHQQQKNGQSSTSPGQESKDNSQQQSSAAQKKSQQPATPKNSADKNQQHTPLNTQHPEQATAQHVPGSPQLVKQSVQQREQQQAVDQLLRQVPDDPGGLLQQIFKRDYVRRHGGL